MKLSHFKFKLPEESIALYPRSYNAETKFYNRDEARLMVVNRKSGEIVHGHVFKDIIDFFDEGDVFIFNDTRVFPARLYGNKEKTGARIEVFLLRELNEDQRLWDVLVDPARKIRIGNKLYFGDENTTLVAEVIDNTTSRGRTLRFLTDMPHDEFKRKLYSLGESPLPNDVHLLRETEEEDHERFQNIFAVNEGAVTAPVTGLHFSRILLKRMEIKGIEQAFITLHAGLGNFRSIDVEDLSKHKQDSEQMLVSKQACDLFNTAKLNGHKNVAIGSTTLRALETCVGPGGLIKEFDGWTNKFIFPPYDFDTVDAFVVNFHMPLSPMLMTACAFGGYDLIMKAYDEAVKEGYKFGTFGDSMLII